MPTVDRRTFLLAGAALATAGCSADPPARRPVPPQTSSTLPAVAIGPSDAEAGADARKILAWLTALPQRDTKRVVSGQQIPPGGRPGYDSMVRGLARRTGRTPALLGATFDGYWQPGTVPVLIEHWQAGGLVTMDMHPPNPFVPNGGPESARIDAALRKPDLRELLSDAPATPQRTRWRAELDRFGDVLEKLADAGAVVILRPLHEQNGEWFWWGEDQQIKRTAVRELYQDMHTHYTRTRGLHNLLWAHGPAIPWNAPRMKYYPGDDYVDLIGPSCYSDQMRLAPDGQSDDTTDLEAVRKPMGLLEVGPAAVVDGSWDAGMIITAIRERYPRMTMFNCWHGWTGVTMELVNLRNSERLMTDPWVITLENIDWRV